MDAWTRIDEELSRRNKGWQWLADQLGFKIQRVHNWKDKTRGVPPSQYRAIASILLKTVDWIEGLEPSHSAQEPTAKYENQPSNVASITPKKQVPLISWVRAGGWGEINDHDPETTETVPANYSQPGRYAFALSVDGDSMTTNVGLSFPHGTIIIVDPDRGAVVGDFVVAKDTTTQKATFKRLASDGGRWYLRPQNKEYPTLEIDHPEKRIIGVVIEFYIGSKL